MEKSFISSLEITLILILEERRKAVHDSWFGSGNEVLYNVRNVLLQGQCHRAVLPKDLDGISVIAFSSPAMWRVVSGDAFVTWSQRTRAWMSCIAIGDDFAANRCTQCTLGLLSLYNATCVSVRFPTTLLITKKSRSKAANSKSELVNVPCGLASDFTAWVTAVGHWNRKTVGGMASRSPTMTPLHQTTRHL